MKIFLLPGLGFDYRIFGNLDLSHLDIEYLEWIEPEDKETFSNYAERLSVRVEDNSEKLILIGHSLGGMLCQEISVIKNIEKIILISSIKSRKELPFHFRIVHPFYLHKLFTKKSTINTLKYWGKKHDYESSEEQELFKDMIGNQSDKYLQWALSELSKWQSPIIPAHTDIFQIHGNQDKTFPIKLIDKPNITVENAGHFMIYKQPKKINEILLKII